MKAVLGIDTSCYVTSVAVVAEGGVVADLRRPLAVERGSLGLRQAEAVFAHVRALPDLLEEALQKVQPQDLAAVAASIRPRPLPESYLPVFKAGEGFGRWAARLLGCPFFPASHQAGHLWAGIWSADLPLQEGPFLAVHLSGGTTELLYVEPAQAEGRLRIEVLGRTLDLAAGQMVDRVGVALGLDFPAGPALERLAGEAEEERPAERDGKEGRVFSLPAAVRGYDLSFSGATSAALRALERGVEPAVVARAVQRCISKALEKVLRRAVAETGIRRVLLVGGVAANSFLRERLKLRLEHRAVGARLYFADPRWSGDNAVGVALLGLACLEEAGERC
ncbi:MAG: O-sialoglycoprotein endopeptidase [Bacillota bacterium]|nr:O-sialoglycoprotein endopeptidase [Bacillota bacterium]